MLFSLERVGARVTFGMTLQLFGICLFVCMFCLSFCILAFCLCMGLLINVKLAFDPDRYHLPYHIFCYFSFDDVA